MEMKPYARKARNHNRATAQYNHPQGPPYYTAMDYTAAAATAPGIYTTPYPTSSAAYYPPQAQPPYFGFPTDKSTVEGMVRKQIEYYFSDENLIKDVFLRNEMDAEGYVLLNKICSFQRVVSLTQDMDTVLSALKESETIEICDGIKIRPKKDPLRWPFPVQLQYLPQPQATLVPPPLTQHQQPQLQQIQLQQQQLQQPPLIQAQQPERTATRLPAQPHQQNLSQRHQQPTSTSLNDQADPELSSPQPLLQQQQQQQQHQHQHQHQQQQQQPPQPQSRPPALNQHQHQHNQQRQNVQQSRHQQQPSSTSLNHQNDPELSSQQTPQVRQQVQPHHQQRQNHKQLQPQPGQTQVDASSPNDSDTFSGTNHVDNTNRSSFTYATAVTNKPTVASVVAGSTTTSTPATPAPVVANSSGTNANTNKNNNTNCNNNCNNNHSNSSNSSKTNSSSCTAIESEWKEVKSRRRKPGRA